jgi:FkbM family methyltransferase
MIEIAEFIGHDKPTIIEAGTGMGEDLLHYSGMYPGGKLYAFEPNIKQYTIVQKLLEQHNRTNVELYANALGQKTGDTLKLHVSDRFDQPWGSSSLLKPKEHLKHHPQITFKEAIDVKIVNLDDFIARKKIATVDYLELDLQGMEPAVLMAAPNILKITKNLYTEVNLIEQYEGNILYPEYKNFLLSAGLEIVREEINENDGNVLLRNKNL